MVEAKEFPPQQVRDIVSEVAGLLKERKETVSVAETVSLGCSLLTPRPLLQALPLLAAFYLVGLHGWMVTCLRI